MAAAISAVAVDRVATVAVAVPAVEDLGVPVDPAADGVVLAAEDPAAASADLADLAVAVRVETDSDQAAVDLAVVVQAAAAMAASEAQVVPAVPVDVAWPRSAITGVIRGLVITSASAAI
jgi:hypothetical protein